MQNLTFNTFTKTERRGKGPYLIGPERRCGISDMELAAAILSDALSYLSENQLAGRYLSLEANREAIRLLCQAAQEIYHSERRAPARRSIAAWLFKI